MCGGGGKGTGGYNPMGGQWGNLTPQQQQTTTASPQAIGWYQDAMAKAQQAAATPWQNYSTDPAAFVAQLNSQQQAAQQGIAGQAAATAPFAQMGAGMQAAAGLGNAAQMAGSYMSPFMQQVVSPVQQALQQQQGQQLAQQQADAISGGAFGGERAGLQRATLQGQQELAMGQALSPLYQTGYGQALGAAQTDLERQLQAGQGLSQAGLAAQQASLGAGTLGQQTQQAGLSALYNQWQQARMYPYQQAQFLAGIAGGLGPLMGQQSYQSQATNPFGMFLADGGAVDENRMGGAVTNGGDFARGGYATRGGVDEDPLAIQEQMYKDIEKPVETSLPTGQVQAAQGLKPADFAPTPKQESALDKASKVAGLAKEGIGGLKNAYDWLTGPTKVTGAAGSLAVPTYGGGILGGLGSTLSEIGSGIASFLPFALNEGGVVPRDGYADRGAVEPDDRSADYMARTMLKEAGGEGPEGMEAVGHVISNRLEAGRYGKDIPSVVTAPKQFSPWNTEARGTSADPRLVDTSSKSYQNALGLARKVLAGETEDPTGGATHFYNPKLASPKWGAGMENAIQLGQHRFGRADAGADQAGVAAALKRATPEQRKMMALDTSDRSGVAAAAPENDSIFKEENVLPAISGLGAALEGMVTSPTVGLGGALLRGAGAGMKEGVRSALEVPKVRAETLERQHLAQKALEEARYRAAEIPKVGAEIGEIGARTDQIKGATEKLASETVDSSIQVKDGRTFIRYVDPNTGTYNWMPFQDYYALDPSKRPIVDPRAVQKIIVSDPSSIVTKPSPTTAEGKPQTEISSGAAGSGVGSGAKPQTSISTNPEQATTAFEITKNKAGWPSERRNSEPDYFTPQDEIAKGIQNQKQLIVPLAGALAALPQDKSILASGKAQEILSPVAGILNNIAAVAGYPGLIVDPKSLTSQEEVNKLVNQLQQAATTASQQHAFAAFKEMAQGIPGITNSPGGQAKLIAQILTNNQREIDKNHFFADWADKASGPNKRFSEFARLSSREANRAFDDKYTNAYYAGDRAELEKMFNKKIRYKEDGKTEEMSYLTALAQHPSMFKPEQLDRIEKEHPGVLRYFGINR